MLLIDDDRDLLRGLSLRLRRAGHEVDTAADGASGLSLATSVEPDVVLLDLELPGMRGSKVLHELRRLPERVPVVVITGHLETNPEHLRHYDVDAVLHKPIDLPELLASIERAIGGHHG